MPRARTDRVSLSADAMAAAPIAQASTGSSTVKVPPKRSTIATAEPAMVPQAR